MTDRDQAIAIKEQDEAFFKEAFGLVPNIPKGLKVLATRICRAYGIRGICDPAYIANVIAFELGLGDGQGNFTEKDVS